MISDEFIKPTGCKKVSYITNYKNYLLSKYFYLRGCKLYLEPFLLLCIRHIVITYYKCQKQAKLKSSVIRFFMQMAHIIM